MMVMLCLPVTVFAEEISSVTITVDASQLPENIMEGQDTNQLKEDLADAISLPSGLTIGASGFVNSSKSPTNQIEEGEEYFVYFVL